MQILEVNMLTSQLRQTASFYRDILELDLTRQDDKEIAAKAGSSVIRFRESSYSRPTYHFAFNIPCNQINEAVEWLVQKTQLIEVTPGKVIADFVNWNARSVYFYDNNGNILELIARFDLNNPSDKKFGGHSLISVSEMGVVTNNVAQTATHLKNHYQLPAFSKQPLLTNFGAIGDDNGLLVLSLPKRHWYPTTIEAEHFPASIRLLHKKDLIWLEV